MKKTIFFDFGRTLVEHPEDGIGLQIVRAAGATNEEDAKTVRDVVFSVDRFMNDLDEGLLSFEDYIEQVTASVPERLRDCAQKAAAYDIYELPLIDGMENLLQELKAEGYRLCITSNLNLRQAKQMRTHKIAKYFDGMIFSAEIHTRKPRKAFFETALTTFGVKADDCIFVDDLEENVLGAEKCGIKSIVFKGDADDLKKKIVAIT